MAKEITEKEMREKAHKLSYEYDYRHPRNSSMFDMMVEFAQQMCAERDAKWISIFKESPEFGQGVLVALNTGLITVAYRTKQVNKGYNQKYSWQLFGDKEVSLGVSEDDYITHWMPLPKIPTIPINH